MAPQLFNPFHKDKMDALLLTIPGVLPGVAYGYPVYTADGKLFACVIGNGVAVKVPQRTAKRLIEKRKDVTSFQPAPGKEWREWVLINHADSAEYEQEQELFSKSIAFVTTPRKKQSAI